MPPWHIDGNWMALPQSLHFLRGSRKQQDKDQRGWKLDLADSTPLWCLVHVDSWNLISMEAFQADNLRAQAVFTSPCISIWRPGFLPLLILGPNPGRPAPPVQSRRRTTIISSGPAVLLNPRWAVLVPLSCWRFWGLVCEGWAGFKHRAWLQRTPFVFARHYILIVFRDSLFSLFASLSSLYSACLPFGHFTWHPQTLELSLDRNCRIWCGMPLFPQLLFLECLSHPPLLYPLPLLITGLPTKWC